MARKQTSDKMSGLASIDLSSKMKPTENEVKGLADIVLSQDETKGKWKK